MDAFYLKLTLCFAIAGAVFWVMEILHRRKVAEAERQFQMTLQAIEARNKIHDPYKSRK